MRALPSVALGHVHIHGAEGAHGVHNKAQVVVLHDFRDTHQIVDEARSRFVVYDADRRDFGMCGNHRLQTGSIDAFVPSEVFTHKGDAVALQNLAHAFRICAVDGHEHAVILTYHGTENTFHAERTRTLHQHGGVIGFGNVGKREEFTAHELGHFFVIVVPRAAIDKHFLTNGQ